VGATRPEDPRAVLRRHGLRPKKSWGQNFLINLDLAERIADAVAASGAACAIEIGAGAGTLTAALAARLPRVVAVERDPELAALLEAERAGGRLGDNVEVVPADAATFDYAGAAARHGGPAAVVGNLPYNLTGKLLRRIIEARGAIGLALVMVQLEVAERLVAAPGTDGYGVLTVMSQAWLDAEIQWRVSPGSFFPRPRVSSAVVRLAPQAAPRAGDVDEAALAGLVHAAFAARRKTLRNTLGAAYDRDRALAALEAEGIDPGLRAEVLSVEQLAALARRLAT
jgi:16S rRNA (adenine1518-N6/adenine1519-N6)-dimethyltransferase